jgi:anti-sigma regulatory factor (Ser/Thr protein kinase)
VDTGLLEIGAVARLLGVAPGTLRTWERRYCLVVPHRGAQGQRLYDGEQILALRQIAAEVRRGVRARIAHDRAVAPRPTRTARIPLAPSAAAPSLARQVVTDFLEKNADPRIAFDARLVASELVKNAVIHGSGREPLQIDLALYPDWLELRVQNSGGRLTIKGLRRKRREGGRGLEIVDALAESWSIDTGPLGTGIRVRLPIPRDGNHSTETPDPSPGPRHTAG